MNTPTSMQPKASSTQDQNHYEKNPMGTLIQSGFNVSCEYQTKSVGEELVPNVLDHQGNPTKRQIYTVITKICVKGPGVNLQYTVEGDSKISSRRAGATRAINFLMSLCPPPVRLANIVSGKEFVVDTSIFTKNTTTTSEASSRNRSHKRDAKLNFIILGFFPLTRVTQSADPFKGIQASAKLTLSETDTIFYGSGPSATVAKNECFVKALDYIKTHNLKPGVHELGHKVDSRPPLTNDNPKPQDAALVPQQKSLSAKRRIAPTSTPEGSRNHPPLRGSRNQPPLRGSRNQPPLRGSRNQPPLRGSWNQPSLRGSSNKPSLRERSRFLRPPPRSLPSSDEFYDNMPASARRYLPTQSRLMRGGVRPSTQRPLIQNYSPEDPYRNECNQDNNRPQPHPLFNTSPSSRARGISWAPFSESYNYDDHYQDSFHFNPKHYDKQPQEYGPDLPFERQQHYAPYDYEYDQDSQNIYFDQPPLDYYDNQYQPNYNDRPPRYDQGPEGPMYRQNFSRLGLPPNLPSPSSSYTSTRGRGGFIGNRRARAAKGGYRGR